ncbi:MAG: hypothetical protein IT363_12960 [Methanoregulaceae archaeon]|nr:hypothetical protein [Methanoregulaceae archaeon]
MAAELLVELEQLNPRGRAKTERKLREIYAAGDADVRVAAAHFLLEWQSSRSLAVADDWLAQSPDYPIFVRMVTCYATTSYADTYDRFMALFARTDLSADEVDVLVDWFGSWAEHRNRDPRYKSVLALIATYLDHESPEIRWTAAFRMGCLRATPYRDRLVELEKDKTLTAYGYVSAVARNAIRAIDGERDVDMRDARIE